MESRYRRNNRSGGSKKSSSFFEEIKNRLQDAGVPIDFTIEGTNCIVSEIVNDDDGDPFVIVVRRDGVAFFVEIVTIAVGLWTRQYSYRPDSVEALERQLFELASKTPSP